MIKPLILLVGKSGSGKNYFVNKMKLNPIVSYTTRPKRKGEIDGVDHWFVNEVVYKGVNKEEIGAYTFYNNNHYWSMIDQCFSQDYDVYIIDPIGVKNLKDQFKKYSSLCSIKERPLIIWYLDTSPYRRFIQMKRRGDPLKNIFSRLWHDFWAFGDPKLNSDIIIKWSK